MYCQSSPYNAKKSPLEFGRSKLQRGLSLYKVRTGKGIVSAVAVSGSVNVVFRHVVGAIPPVTTGPIPHIAVCGVVFAGQRGGSVAGHGVLERIRFTFHSNPLNLIDKLSRILAEFQRDSVRA